MKTVIGFLRQLHRNNNREWFMANKPLYQQALVKFNTFAEGLMESIAVFDPTVRGLTLKDCTYRIYRDVRFSHDKSPYKTHMGVFVAPGGKKSGLTGYYFHIEPDSEVEKYRYFIVTGTYNLPTAETNSIREDIVLEGAGFEKTLKRAEGFLFGSDEKYKRVPSGFPTDSPYAEYLKCKNFQLLKPLSEEDILKEGLADWLAKEFYKTMEFKERLNRAIEFVREDKK